MLLSGGVSQSDYVPTNQTADFWNAAADFNQQNGLTLQAAYDNNMANNQMLNQLPVYNSVPATTSTRGVSGSSGTVPLLGGVTAYMDYGYPQPGASLQGGVSTTKTGGGTTTVKTVNPTNNASAIGAIGGLPFNPPAPPSAPAGQVPGLVPMGGLNNPTELGGGGGALNFPGPGGGRGMPPDMMAMLQAAQEGKLPPLVAQAAMGGGGMPLNPQLPMAARMLQAAARGQAPPPGTMPLTAANGLVPPPKPYPVPPSVAAGGLPPGITPDMLVPSEPQPMFRGQGMKPSAFTPRSAPPGMPQRAPGEQEPQMAPVDDLALAFQEYGKDIDAKVGAVLQGFTQDVEQTKQNVHSYYANEHKRLQGAITATQMDLDKAQLVLSNQAAARGDTMDQTTRAKTAASLVDEAYDYAASRVQAPGALDSLRHPFSYADRQNAAAQQFRERQAKYEATRAALTPVQSQAMNDVRLAVDTLGKRMDNLTKQKQDLIGDEFKSIENGIANAKYRADQQFKGMEMAQKLAGTMVAGVMMKKALIDERTRHDVAQEALKQFTEDSKNARAATAEEGRNTRFSAGEQGKNSRYGGNQMNPVNRNSKVWNLLNGQNAPQSPMERARIAADGGVLPNKYTPQQYEQLLDSFEKGKVDEDYLRRAGIDPETFKEVMGG